MMKNRKKGFTIVELLVVITLIGVLSIFAGVSMNKLLKKNRDKGYQESYDKIFEAIHICYKMSSCNDIFASGSTENTIEGLISKGVLDESILNSVDGLTGNKFTTDYIVSIDGSNTAEVKKDSNSLSESTTSPKWIN